jgi:hypothetical protein
MSVSARSSEDDRSITQTGFVGRDTDIHRVQDAAARNHVLVGAVASDPTRYGLTGNEITRYDNAINVQNGLTRSGSRPGQTCTATLPANTTSTAR